MDPHARKKEDKQFRMLSNSPTPFDTKKIPHSPLSLGNNHSVYLSNLRAYQQQSLRSTANKRATTPTTTTTTTGHHGAAAPTTTPISPQHNLPPNHPLSATTAQSVFQQQQAKRLQYFHNRPPVYVVNPSFTLQDFELMDTLGNVYYINTLHSALNSLTHPTSA